MVRARRPKKKLSRKETIESHQDNQFGSALAKYFGTKELADVEKHLQQHDNLPPNTSTQLYNLTPLMSVLGVKKSISKWAEGLPNFSVPEASRFRKHVSSSPTFTPLFQSLCDIEIGFHIYAETGNALQFEAAFEKMGILVKDLGKLGSAYYDQWRSTYQWIMAASEVKTQSRFRPGKVKRLLQNHYSSFAERYGVEWLNQPAFEKAVRYLHEAITTKIQFKPDSKKNKFTMAVIIDDIAAFMTAYLISRHKFKEIRITSRQIREIVATASANPT